jgi:hypothetical protein
MLSNRLAFIALAVACVGAAAGGGYLATRQNTVPAPVAASAPAPAATTAAAPATPAPAADAKPVQETEAVVAEAPMPVAPAPKASAAKPAAPPARVSTPSSSRAASATVARHEQLPAVSSSSAALQVPAPPAPVVVEGVPASPWPDEHAAQEPVRPAEPPAHTFAEYVVSAESVIGLQTETRVSSETARVEDRVEARVTRDVRVGGHVAIPAGARAIGSVMQVERGGKFKEKARLGIRFHTLVLADGTRIPISTETIYREGEGPGASTSQKMGGAAVGGAILGASLGGGKGMAIGAAAGAGAGGAAVAAGDRNAATLAAGTSMTVRILQPITVTRERD